MKVTKKGKLPEDKLYVGTCSHCGCEFEVTEKEITWVEDRGQDHPVWENRCPTIGCPMHNFWVTEKYEGEI